MTDLRLFPWTVLTTHLQRTRKTDQHPLCSQGTRFYLPYRESFGFGSVSSRLSSGRSYRFAHYDFHTKSLIEDFSKEKVGMEPSILARRLALSAEWRSTLFPPFYDLREAIAFVKYPTVVFQNGRPKLFVSLPDWGHTYAARAYGLARTGRRAGCTRSLDRSRGSVANCRHLGKQNSACCMYRPVDQVAGCSLHSITCLVCANI